MIHFAARADGTRLAELTWRNGASVKVDRSYGADAGQDQIDTAAHEIADASALVSRLFADVERLKLEVRRLERLVPPPRPAALFGPGFVRFIGDELWLLADRTKGLASFGFRLDSWDDLFRRYNVRITEHGCDETGPYWVAMPITEAV